MVSENFDIEFQSRFDELMKARRASVGEIRVWNDGIARKKKPDGGWVPVEKNYKNSQIIPHEDKFGRNYSEFAGKPKEALDFLIDKKEGQVKNVWEREDIGDIDLVYGKKNFGLKHIIGKHVGITEDGKEKDFKDEKELSSTVDKLLKEGKLVKDYIDENGFRKRILSLGKHTLVITQTIVVDNEDNFKEKRWIVTSYDPTRTMREKGIKKAIPEEIAFKKEVNSSNPLQNSLEKGVTLSTFSPNALSLPKDTTNMNDMQQFVDEIIEKSKKGAPIGTERTWGGKVYIRTENGWKPKSGAKKAKKEDDQTDKTSSKVNDVNSSASKASDEQLQAAINDKDALPEVKQAAQEELNKRNPKEENNSNTGITDALQRLLAAQEKGEIDLGEEVLGKIKDKLESQKQKKSESLTEETLDKKLDKLKEDITSKIDEKLNELNGFKKITQTYVKQDGKTIVLKMKGDNQYKASSPGFKLESKPYESLVDFKKRIKEEFNKQFSKIEDKEENNIQDQEKDKKTILNFKDKGEYNEYVLRRNSEKENLTKDQIDRFNKAFVEYENDIKDFPEKKLNEIKSYIESQNFNKILHVYSGFTPDSKMVLNRELINQGYLPIANGMLYSIYNNKKYKHFDNQDDKRKFYYAKKSTPNLVETKALEYYMDMGYNSVRAVNIGKEKNTTVEQISSTISSFIDKILLKICCFK